MRYRLDKLASQVNRQTNEKVNLHFSGSAEGDLKFRLNASEDSPVVNPAFVIKDWGKSDVELKVDGLRNLLKVTELGLLPLDFYEDNQAYLDGVCAAFPTMTGHFIPSEQGH